MAARKITILMMVNDFDLTWLYPDFIFQLLRFVPVAWVGSRRLVFLIPDLQAVLFVDRCHLCCDMTMSFLVSFELLNMEPPCWFQTWLQDEDWTTCPYHRRRLERKAAVTACIPSLAHNKSMDIASCGFTLHINRIIGLSVRRSRCKSGAVGAQVSLPWRKAERTQSSNTFPRTVRDMCCESIFSTRHHFVPAHKRPCTNLVPTSDPNIG